MSTDLVTYYGQTDLINQLVDNYGAYLEKLDRETKVLLRITLAYYVFAQPNCSQNYSVLEAARDALYVRFIFDDILQQLRDVCSLLNSLTVNEAEIILDALQHQLRCGNARKMMS